jgi:hypothetical protein
MTYAALMVPLPFGQPNATLPQVVGDLAERFHAGVIGVAACRPQQRSVSARGLSASTYTSRSRRLGGASRTLPGSMTVPVLMSH